MEVNNSHFEVLGSVDGDDFRSVGFVEGSGNTDLLTNYQFSCKDCSFNDYRYYRLKQVDFDGIESLHGLVHVSCEQEVGFLLYPTLVDDELTLLAEGIDFSHGQVSLEIYDQLGVEQHHIDVYQAKEIISLSRLGLVSGLYHVVLRQGALSESKLFVKK